MASRLMVDGVGAQETGATGRKLECLDGEGEVLIIGVVDEEAVIDGLLQALGLVAIRHQRACVARGQTLFDACSLSKSLIMDIDIVYNHTPFALCVLGTKGPHVSGLRWAQVSFLLQGVWSLDRQLGVKINYVSIKGEDLFVVVFGRVFDLVGGILGVFEAPRLGCVGGACWHCRLVSVLVGRLGMVGGRRVV